MTEERSTRLGREVSDGTTEPPDFTKGTPCRAAQKIVAVNVFCGVGGLTHGFAKEGIRVVAGIDSDSSCAYAYEHNNGARFVHEDVGNMQAAEVSSLYPEGSIRALVGCFSGSATLTPPTTTVAAPLL